MRGLKFCKFFGIFNYISILILNSTAYFHYQPSVETSVGLIKGLWSSDGKYSMFMGIPYAIVDKNKPFGVSTRHPGFNGDVFEAYDDSATCPQVWDGNESIKGSLDCLCLNIYVPNYNTTKRNGLPVLVWIYGGAFLFGNAGKDRYGPSFLVRHNVILVTINYRVGPYGFMCLDTPEVPGNQGLKDQLLALEWIKTHIESFGGNPNQITVSGQSSGGISVDLHLHYNQKEYFNQAILQSGVALRPSYLVESNRKNPLKMANYLGFFTNDTEEALAFLSTVDPQTVIAVTTALNITFTPCVEKVFKGVEGFITEHPLNKNVPRVKNTNILIGDNNDERIIEGLQPTSNKTHDLLSKIFNFNKNKLAQMVKLIKKFYIRNENKNDGFYRSLVNFYSDFSFNYPVSRTIKKYIENGAINIYQYMFSYDGMRNLMKQKHNVTVGGAAHADELSYLFDISYMKNQHSDEDQLIIDRMTTLWTNFVKYGNPTPRKSVLLPVIWKPVSNSSLIYLNIDSELSLRCNKFRERMAFWDFFYKLNKKSQKGYKNVCKNEWIN